MLSITLPPEPPQETHPHKYKHQQGENKVEKWTIGTARNRQHAVKTNTKRQKNNKNATAICGLWSTYLLIYLSTYLSVCLSISLSIYLPIYLAV